MADRAGRSVVQADGLAEALRAVRSGQLAAVLLDLDLPSQGAWEVADSLLQEAGCPPVILLTGRRDQFDVSTAIRAGSLVDKSASLAKLLEVVDQALALPDCQPGGAERHSTDHDSMAEALRVVGPGHADLPFLGVKRVGSSQRKD